MEWPFLIIHPQTIIASSRAKQDAAIIIYHYLLSMHPHYLSRYICGYYVYCATYDVSMSQCLMYTPTQHPCRPHPPLLP